MTKILLIGMFIITLFMYLVIVGASKNKTAEEKRLEDKEQIEYFKNYNCRRQKYDNQDKKKWNISCKFR